MVWSCLGLVQVTLAAINSQLCSMLCPEDSISNVPSNVHTHTILPPLPSCYPSLGDRGDTDVPFRGEHSQSLVFSTWVNNATNHICLHFSVLELQVHTTTPDLQICFWNVFQASKKVLECLDKHSCIIPPCYVTSYVLCCNTCFRSLLRTELLPACLKLPISHLSVIIYLPHSSEILSQAQFISIVNTILCVSVVYSKFFFDSFLHQHRF